ncbi:MAG: hypothetical protein RB148_11745 [Armatimonadota bacterium]|nr:hypothetical protein [Armatimonadota bacterium]
MLALFAAALAVAPAAPVGAGAADRVAEPRVVCAYREARMWHPWVKGFGDTWRQWRMRVCLPVEEREDGTVLPLAERPEVGVTVFAPMHPVWDVGPCNGWYTRRNNGHLWVYGRCQVRWRVWVVAMPVPVGTWDVEQAFDLATGYQDIAYPLLWRGGDDPPLRYE